MYIPPIFRNDHPDELKAFVRSHPFALLISNSGDVPEVTHIPFELVEEGSQVVLLGHISAVNPHRKLLESGKALAVFSGSHAYVSAALYNHPNVSTWNYCVVHISGPVRELIPDELAAHLKRMMRHYDEGKRTAGLEHLPEGMFEKMQKGVFGFCITVEKMEGNWKMSQNRTDADFKQIVEALEKGSLHDQEVAVVMKQQRPHIFGTAV